MFTEPQKIILRDKIAKTVKLQPSKSFHTWYLKQNDNQLLITLVSKASPTKAKATPYGRLILRVYSFVVWELYKTTLWVYIFVAYIL